MTAPAKPWPHPWPKGGRPPVIPNAKRWNLYVDAAVQERAVARASRHGSDLPTVMRALMEDYAAGRVKPSPLRGVPADGEPEIVSTTPDTADHATEE